MGFSQAHGVVMTREKVPMQIHRLSAGPRCCAATHDRQVVRHQWELRFQIASGWR
jgi:hypothetical protein